MQLTGHSKMPSNPFAGVDPAVQQFMQIMYSENEKLISQLRQKHDEIRKLKQAHAIALHQKNQELQDLRMMAGQLLGNGTAARPAVRGGPAGQSMPAGEHFSTEACNGGTASVVAAAASPNVTSGHHHPQPVPLVSGNTQEERAALHNPAAATAPAQDSCTRTVPKASENATPTSELEHADDLMAVQQAGTKRPRSADVSENIQQANGEEEHLAAAAPDSLPQSKRANKSNADSRGDDTASQALAANAASDRAAAKGFRLLSPGTFTLTPCNCPAQQQSAAEQLQQQPVPAMPAATPAPAQATETPAQLLTNMLHKLQQPQAAATGAGAGATAAAGTVSHVDMQAVAGGNCEDQDAAGLLQLVAALGGQQCKQPASTNEAYVQAVAHEDAARSLSLHDMVLTLKTLHRHSAHDNNSAAARGSSGGGTGPAAAAMPQLAAQQHEHAFNSYHAQRATLSEMFTAAGPATAQALQAAAPAPAFGPSHLALGCNLHALGNRPAPITDVPAVMQRLLGSNSLTHTDNIIRVQQASAAGAAAASDGYAASAFGCSSSWQTNWQAYEHQEGLTGGHGIAAAAAGMTDTDFQRRSLGSFAGAGRRNSKGTRAGDGDVDGLFEPNTESHWRLEIERQVPARVQQAILADWEAKPEPRELSVVCNGHEGTFFVDPITKDCMVRTATGQQLKPTQFERQCDKGQAKDWQRSIRVPGYEGKNGPIKMGHFVRIVGISTNRKSVAA